ncbi:MAG: dUTP diphosphatase [Symbiobacteriaceae bacterium]|nr:dUTP diphosphatase [Symbiobacteriaceae bacterium]
MEEVKRCFALISAYAESGLILPERKTQYSAAYDIAAAEETLCPPNVVTLIPTGLKVYLPPEEFLLLALRSSLALNRGLMMANGVGVIDADYADNPTNEGHIQILVWNTSSIAAYITAGERIAQGIFLPYLRVEGEDREREVRRGGLGSTGRR